MNVYIHRRRFHFAYRLISFFIILTFTTGVVLPPVASAQAVATVLNLPVPGAMVPLSHGFTPAMVTGITVHPENPLAFDFIIGTGDAGLDGAAFKEESRKLIKYFLATLTVPNEELWVNLSPYEKDRIVPQSFGDTEMGRDMLAQDYILKQLTASLMYPEDDLGKKFWGRVYAKAREKYGTSEIPMNTFNKIWIVPEDAVVYEHGNSAFVVKSHMKVMLEEDYVALQNNLGIAKYGLDSLNKEESEVISGVTSAVVKEVLIPEIEKEVNEGETFANLRQIYNSVILATWYERNLRGSLLGQLYVDRGKTKGIDNEDKEVNQKIYDQYTEAFKKGVYNYIKEETDPVTREVTPRKYFSGGTNFDLENKIITVNSSSSLAQEYADDIHGIVSSPVKEVGVRLADLGPNAKDADGAVAAAEGAKPGTVSSPIKTIDIRTVDHLKQYLQENPFVVDATLEAFLRAIKDLTAQGALASGGLGYLAGDTYRGFGEIGERVIGFMPLYEHYFDQSTKQRIGIDWDYVDGVKRLVDAERGYQKALRLDVEFNGNIYNVKVYLILEGKTPVIAVRQSEIFYMLYPEEPGKLRQMAFLGRVYVELFKRLGVAPDILRLNEPQLFFLVQAMENDIAYFNNGYFRQQRKFSIFGDTNVQLTTHTPESAALPVYTDRNWVRDNIDKEGKGLASDALFVDGKLDLARRLASNRKIQIINAVSQEHADVTRKAVLNVDDAPAKTVGITNGSDRNVWTNPEILGIENQGREVSGEDLYVIGQHSKEKLNEYLLKKTGKGFLDLGKPLVGLVRRLVEYKSQDILFGIVEHIVGDRDKQYDTPWGRRNGLGMNLLVGGVGRDDVGKQWVGWFKELAEREDLKGKFIFLEGSNTEIMDLSAQASDVWVSMPRSTREAAGTSDQRAAFNGHLNIATATGGPLEYIAQGVNGWLMDVFDKASGYTFDEVVRFMELPNNYRDKKNVVELYRKRSQELLAQYLGEASQIYYAHQTNGDSRWAQMMKSSYETAKDKLDIVRMARQYSASFDAIRKGRADPDLLKRLGEKFKNISMGGSSPVVLKEGAKEVNVAAREQKVDIIFGTNGAREEMERFANGENVGDGPFTHAFVGRIANALLQVALQGAAKGTLILKNPGEGLKVLVSYDARKGAQKFAQTVYRSIAAYQGIVVHMAREVTNSPDAAYQSLANYDLVVQITASHNPENWNGLKLFADGMVAPDGLVKMIEEEANSPQGRSAYFEIPEDQAVILYKDVFAASAARKERVFANLKEMLGTYRRSHPDAQMTVDVMGGAATNYASRFEALGIRTIRPEPMSGTRYFNRDGELYSPNPTIASNFGTEFDEFKEKAPDGSVYFGLDGDVDRLVVWVKHQGKAAEINPSALGMLYLDYLLSHKERIGGDQNSKTLVAGKTLPTTVGLDALAAQAGIELVIVPVGSKNFRGVLMDPRKIVTVATEESGHQVLTMGGETFFDDAVTQMYLVLEMMGRKAQNPVEMFHALRARIGFDLEFGNNALAFDDTVVELFLRGMRENPQAAINTLETKVGKKAQKIFVVTRDNRVAEYVPGVDLDATQGVHMTFADDQGKTFWVYFRKSGMEPKFRVYRESEGKNPELFKLAVDTIRETAASSPVVSMDHRMTIRDIPDEWYTGKVVAVRADLNVPINKEGKITDDSRIRAALPTIQYLLERGAKVVLMSHLGDEKDFVSKLEKQYLKEGMPSEEAKNKAKEEGGRLFKDRRSLKIIYEWFTDNLSATNIYFPGFRTTKEANGFLSGAVHPGEMLLLENVRFNKGETKNDANFAADLFDGVDLFVLEAFGAAHRAHASIVGAPQEIPRVAGDLVVKETSAVDKVVHDTGLAVLGGSKVTDKIKIIQKLLGKAATKHILIGGAMANAFFAADGKIPVGSAKGAEPEEIEIARKLLSDAQARERIILPSDVLAVDNFVNPKQSKVIDLGKDEQVPEGWVIVDIGPNTLSQYKNLFKGVPEKQYIFWNGPMGVFDQEKLASMGAENGTKGITLALAELKGNIPVVVGGGDSGVAVMKYVGDPQKFDHVSTGGGAFLEGLEKGAAGLPGVAALTEKVVEKEHLDVLARDVSWALKYLSGEKLVRGISEEIGAKLLGMIPLAEEDRARIENFEVSIGNGVIFERHAYAVELGGKKIVVYLTPEMVDLIRTEPKPTVEFMQMSEKEIAWLESDIYANQSGLGQFMGPVQITVQEYKNLIRIMFEKAGFFDNYRLFLEYIREAKPIREKIDDLSVFFASLHGRSDDVRMKREYEESMKLLTQREDEKGRRGDMSQKRDYLSGSEEKRLQAALLRAALGELPDAHQYITVLNVVSRTQGVEDAEVLIVPERLKDAEESIQAAVNSGELNYEHENRDYPIARFRVDTTERVIAIVPAASSPVDDGKKAVGGINLNPELLDLQIKRDGNGVPLPLPQQPIEHMRIDGFVPIIINVAPVADLPFLLGVADSGLPVNSPDSGFQPLELSLAVKEN